MARGRSVRKKQQKVRDVQQEKHSHHLVDNNESMDIGLLPAVPIRIGHLFDIDTKRLERMLKQNDDVYPFVPLQYSFRIVARLKSYDFLRQTAIVEDVFCGKRKRDCHTIEFDTSSVGAFPVCVGSVYMLMGDIERAECVFPLDPDKTICMKARLIKQQDGMDVSAYNNAIDQRFTHESLNFGSERSCG